MAVKIVRRYECHECKSEHSPENVCAYCVVCVGRLKDRIRELESALEVRTVSCSTCNATPRKEN